MPPQKKSGSPSKPRQKVVQLHPKSHAAPASDNMAERLAAVEQNQRDFVKAFNGNMAVYQNVLHSVDVMLHVQQRVANDLVKWQMNILMLQVAGNGVATPLVNPLYCIPDGLIDYPRYIAEYYGCVGFIEFVLAAERFQQQQQQQQQRRTEAAEAPEEEHVTEFGGGP